MKKYKIYLWCFGLAFIPRMLLLIYHLKFPGTIIDDLPRGYWYASTGLLTHGTLSIGGVAVTHLEPLYPVFLAVCRLLSGDSYAFVLLCQILILSVGNIFFYKLVISFTSNPRTAFIASVLYAFYPYVMRRSLKIAAMTLVIPLLIGAIYAYRKADKPRYALVSGIACGLLVITRSMLLPFIGIMSVFLLLKKFYRQWLLFTVPVLMIAATMMFHNYRIDRSLMPTRSGINLFISNCEFTDLLRPEYHLDLLVPYAYELARKEMPDYENKSAKEIDHFFAVKALEFIKKNPVRSLQLKLQNMLYFFSPWVVPFYSLADAHVEIQGSTARIVPANLNQTWRQAPMVMIHAITYGIILITAIQGMFLRRAVFFKEDLPMIGLLLYFLLIYSFYWTSTRLQTPVMFVLMFYSSVGIHSLMEFVQKRGAAVRSKRMPKKNFGVNRISCVQGMKPCG